MTETASNNKRIAKNTFLMYVRMLIVMAINLFAVRFVLKALGQEDYGIFNVVAGLVTMLQSVSAIVSTSTQRFLSYAMGEKQEGDLGNIFSVSINIYIIFSIIVLILAETIGVWFLNSVLIIPEERIVVANILYQLSIITYVVTLFHSPYLSVIIAREEMNVYARISILDCILKFLVAVLLSYVLMDRLVIYGICLLLIPIIILILYIYNTRKYSECRYRIVLDKKLHKEILEFSGWTMFSSIASIGINQIQTILINIFFGPIANAARAISLQISNAISSFCSSFIVAVKPPMIKDYAERSYEKLNKLFNLSNKFLYYSLIMICIPIIYEMDTILYIWLNIKNEQPILFSQLVVIYSIILALNNPISIIVQATGHLREYSVLVESVTLMCPVLTFVLFYLGFPAYYAFVSMIISIAFAHVIRLICVKRLYNKFDIKEYCLNFLLRSVVITVLASLIVNGIHVSIEKSFYRLTLMFISNCTCVVILVWILGLTNDEKYLVRKLLKKVF